MKKQVMLCSVLLLLMLVSSLGAVEKTALAGPDTMAQLEIGAQDVITASDAGGGYMSTRDILLVVLIIFAVIGLIVVL